MPACSRRRTARLVRGGIVAMLALGAWPLGAGAQEREGLDVRLGPGYFYSSFRQPSGPTIEIGATFWFGPRWGVGGAYGVATSDDILEEPLLEGRVRELLGRGELRYLQVLVRRRLDFSSDWNLEIGVGMLGARHKDLLRVTNTTPTQHIDRRRAYGYVSLELVGRRRMSERFGLIVGGDLSIPLGARAKALVSFEAG